MTSRAAVGSAALFFWTGQMKGISNLEAEPANKLMRMTMSIIKNIPGTGQETINRINGPAHDDRKCGTGPLRYREKTVSKGSSE